jgi:hypothetical protein
MQYAAEMEASLQHAHCHHALPDAAVGTPARNCLSLTLAFAVILQRKLETRVVNFVVNFENNRFREVLRRKSARKSIGLGRYSLYSSTKPYLCRQVLFGSFPDMPLNISVVISCAFMRVGSVTLGGVSSLTPRIQCSI